MKKPTFSALALGTMLATLSSAMPAQAGVMVHLFQWKYNDIARECETVLGPKGYDAVQISPPNEHIQGNTWWAVYQPVAYTKFTAHGGNEAELRSMIQRCNAAGVKIYVDAVFNQMTGNSGVGTAGSVYSNRNYPNFGANDFHAPCDLNDYSNRWQVQNCGLLGMPDLNTGSSYVQDQIATYLKTLQGWGVAGFRIDAAKHMSVSDLDAILGKAGRPFNYLEVIGAAGEPIQPSEYLGLGVVTEFKYGTDLAANFNGQIKNLKTLGESWGLMPSGKSQVFVVNHDRERGHGGGGMLTYKNGARYNLANVFMLAWPYGAYPQVMSGYDFGSDTDIGGPSEAACQTGSKWNCDHRWSNIANMVSFHNVTHDATAINHWWDNGNNQIAFARGSKGFVVINNESGSLSRTLPTGLPAGNYCNILAGEALCSGSVITVDGSGNATFNVGGMQAAAIHVGALADGSGNGSGDNGSGDNGADDGAVTARFPSLYFRGTANSWGGTAMTVDSETRTWTTEVEFTGKGDANGAQRFKFDVYNNWQQNYGDANGDGVLDQAANGDILFSGVGRYRVSVSEATLKYTMTEITTDQPPVAAISPATQTVKVGDTLVLDASASTDDGEIVSYAWSTGGTGKTETVTFEQAGVQTITVTVTDNAGQQTSASAVITVQEETTGGDYAFNFASLYFRGTANSWATTPMTLVGYHLWETVVKFDGQANQRFKFDVLGDWSHNYGDNNKDGIAERTGADIFTTLVGSYRVRFNDQTLAYSLSAEQDDSAPAYTATLPSLHFRGTPNSWGALAMTLVANHTWQAEVTFTGNGDSNGSQRFKFDVKGDWSQNYGDTNADGVVEQTGADIRTAVTGTYLVTLNDSTWHYTVSPRP